MKEKGAAVRVKKSEGQRVKNELKSLGLIDEGRMVGSDGKYVYIPVAEEKVPEGYEIVKIELEKRERRKGFRELLIEKFGEENAKGVLSSYDVVGDIAIVQIPGGLQEHGKEVGKLLLEGDAHLKMVENDEITMEGAFPVNPSGGVIASNPIGATAMVRVAEAALQIMGVAGEHQVPKTVNQALASGFGGTLWTVLFLLTREVPS